MNLQKLDLKPEGMTLIDSGAIRDLAAKYEGKECVFMLDNGKKQYTGITYWWNANGTDCIYALMSKRKDGMTMERKLPHYAEVYVFRKD